MMNDKQTILQPLEKLKYEKQSLQIYFRFQLIVSVQKHHYFDRKLEFSASNNLEKYITEYTIATWKSQR